MSRFFADIGLRWKITLPIAFLALLLVLMGWSGMRGIDQVTESSTQLTKRYLPAISLLLNADRDLYQAFVAERSLLDDHAHEHLTALGASHEENTKQAYDRVQQYAAMQPGTEALALVSQFNDNFAKWQQVSRRVMELSVGDMEAASTLSFGDSERLFETLRDSIDKLGELEDQASHREGDAAIDNGREMGMHQGAILLIGLLGCILVVVALPLVVLRPMRRLLSRVEQIAEGDGDLKTRLEVRSADELGQLGSAFNRFLDKLQPLIAEVGRVTGEVDAAARAMASMAATNDQLISSEQRRWIKSAPPRPK
ncbi:MCP four helix bundle domain-containing protein [Pseudomonas mucidolens]|uniref:Methyl-accepting chemotaxis protein n=1 Tax=Pseudomonas mucidolens TaxID=46679 RepID=A0A1H2NKZ8_9PSED|nr:methyl-accepting chemotaxis protein [Pseudomonas mucidolens]SQH31654.1 methyl-accepting chemotaxis protein [Pseudomonas mucidolens]